MSALGKIDKDTVAYMLEVTEDKRQVRLTLISGERIDETMYLNALATYIEDNVDNVDGVYDESVQLFRDEH